MPRPTTDPRWIDSLTTTGPDDQEVKTTSWPWALAQRGVIARAMTMVLTTQDNNREATSPHLGRALVAAERLVVRRTIMYFESPTNGQGGTIKAYAS